MSRTICKLWGSEEGQTMTEYALIIALIPIALIAMLKFFSGRVGSTYGNVCNNLPSK